MKIQVSHTIYYVSARSSGPKKHHFGSVLGTQFGVKCILKKSLRKHIIASSHTHLEAPSVIFGLRMGSPFGATNPLKWKLGMHTLTFEIPRWSQDGPRLPNSLKMAPKLTQNVSQNQCFWDSFSMNYAMLSDIPSIRESR